MLAPLSEPATASLRATDHSEPAAGTLARAWRPLATVAILALLAATLILARPATHPGTNAKNPLQGATLSTLPAGAQGPISAALGADDPSYRVAAAGGGFFASNTQQRLHVRFARSGTTVSSGSLVVKLTLSALGYGGSLHPAGAARASASLNAVSFARSAVTEWYRNGPLGLEQGFTLAHALPASANGTLTLSLALRGNTRAALARDGRSIVLTHAARALRYDGLAAVDARGRSLGTWLALQPGHLLLRVDTRGARYPIRIDPLLAQAKLVPEAGSGKIHFGRSVALSADGNTALVGVPRENVAAGTAWVFTRSGQTWSLQTILAGEGVKSSNFFGRSVALSANGNIALIGDPGASANAGSAWVYTRSVGTWTPRGKLTGKEENGAGEFGRSVALSADGATALVGGYNDTEGAGAAWVFASSGETWEQQGPKLTPSDETGKAQFGWSVALSGDGNTALMGAPHDGHELGAAWVFSRSGTTWAQQGSKLTPSDELGKGQFGSAVSISADGATALIGGVVDAEKAGAAWIFQRSGSTFSQEAKLLGAGEVTPSHFGASVAIAADASTALIGGLEDNEETGAAWVFKRSGSAWTEQGPKLTGSQEIGKAQLGWSVALSANGSTALIGGINDNEQSGAAWVFAEPQPEPPPIRNSAPPLNTNVNTQPSTGVQTFHAENLPAPVLGQTGNITQESGTVLLRLPGSTHFTILKGSAHIPFGTIVDATHGVASITVVGPHGELETGHYFGGIFLITQQHNGVVVATLEGGSFAKCKKTAKHARTAALAARSKRPVRKLWTNAHGSFTTKGTYAAGAVQGTEWLTEDFCEGTLIVVTRDRVKVTDLVHHRTKIVSAGHRYFAKVK